MFCFLISCKRANFENISEINNYLNNEENGLYKSIKHDGLIFSLKYIPPKHFALINKTISNDSTVKSDSLIKLYSNQTSFIFTFSLEDNSKDVMYEGISNQEEYNRRLSFMNFNLPDSFTLKVGDKETKPLLCNFENTYSLTNSRKVNLIFSPFDKNDLNKTIEIFYHDDVFLTGTSLFKFDGNDISKVNLL